MNRINPTKLLHSKWTAVTPENREKHFMVIEVKYDEERNVVATLIEAVITKRVMPIEWETLTDDSRWLHGWK